MSAQDTNTNDATTPAKDAKKTRAELRADALRENAQNFAKSYQALLKMELAGARAIQSVLIKKTETDDGKTRTYHAFPMLAACTCTVEASGKITRGAYSVAKFDKYNRATIVDHAQSKSSEFATWKQVENSLGVSLGRAIISIAEHREVDASVKTTRSSAEVQQARAKAAQAEAEAKQQAQENAELKAQLAEALALLKQLNAK